MVADPSIYGAVPQAHSLVDYAQGYQGLATNALRQQGMQQEMAAKSDELARANALRQFQQTALAGAPPEAVPDLYQKAGYIPQATEARAALDTSAQHRAATDLAQSSSQKNKYELLMQGLTGLTDPEAIRQHLATGVEIGAFGKNPEKALAEAKRHMDAFSSGDPAQVAALRDQMIMGPAAYGTQQGNAAQRAEAARHDAAMEKEAHYGHDVQLSAQQLRADLAEEKLRTLESGGGKGSDWQVLEGPDGFYRANKLTGAVLPLQSGGNTVLGKRGEATAKAAQSAQNVVHLLDQAAGLIPGSTGSGLGNLVDEAANLIGKTTRGAESISRLRVIQGALLAAMPRMEGPQSNYDVQLYQQAAGELSNPNTSRARRLGALQTLREIQSRYTTRGAPAMPAQTADPSQPLPQQMPVIPGRAAAPAASGGVRFLGFE